MTKPLHPVVADVTRRIVERSRDRRQAYLGRLDKAAEEPRRQRLGCANLAHTFAACPTEDKEGLKGDKPSIGIVTAYNDMLSAHQPYEGYPRQIKDAVRAVGGVAQVAGGVPAMCDGITQGYGGMELSLFSRDVIALATAVALSHDTFDGVLCLGICDKIVPGLMIGALTAGHLPVVFVPAGPMPSGLSNNEKSRVRQLYAQGKIGRRELLEAEMQSYHSPGTCTFYGTANTNQMLMEIMGLHLPGASFVNPGTPLRDALTVAAAERVVALTPQAAGAEAPMGVICDERAIVNGIVGLLATGGSTNHTLHIPAIAHAAGIELTWADFAELSAVVPLMARVYPNGSADVNHFHSAGGMPFIISELLDAGLVHADVRTVLADGKGLEPYRAMPALEGSALTWTRVGASGDPKVLSPAGEPFSPEGGLRLMAGNLGRAVMKISAVKPEHRVIEAPARVFDSQEAVQAAFKAGELDRDVVVVVRYQGPQANGMPELHKLMPPLGVLQDKGFAVALVTDGRLSGASGKVPAAIHVTPEVAKHGPLGKVRDGDRIRVDAEHGTLEALVDAAEWETRDDMASGAPTEHFGLGRELFAGFRRNVCGAENGAHIFG